MKAAAVRSHQHAVGKCFFGFGPYSSLVGSFERPVPLHAHGSPCHIALCRRDMEHRTFSILLRLPV
jgi:hypothetical protein